MTPGITLWHRLGLWLKVLTGRDFSPRHSDLSGLHMSPHETWSSSETQEREQADSCVRRILFRNNWNVVYYFKSKYYRKTLFDQHQKAYKEIQNEIVPLCTGVRWLSNGTLLVHVVSLRISLLLSWLDCTCNLKHTWLANGQHFHLMYGWHRAN